MRGDSRLFGAVVALAATALILCTVSPASAGNAKRGPKVTYAEFTQNPQDQSEYRFEAGAKRAKSVVVQLRESPAEGETEGPKETIALDKVAGSSLPVIWRGFTSKVRDAPCYRAAWVARNAHGRSAIAHRLCIFGHHGETVVRATPW